MEKFATYLAAYNGTAQWNEVQHLFDNLFHPDCIFVTADSQLNKGQWAEMARGLAEKGAIASDFEVSREEGESFYYKVTISVGEEEPMHLRAKGTIKDGQIIRVEPVDPSAYSEMVGRSK